MLNTKEFYDIMEQFEKDIDSPQIEKEPKELWKSRQYYCNGAINTKFRLYLQGYAFAKCLFDK